MVQGIVRITPELEQRLNAPGGVLEAHMLELGQQIVNHARLGCPVDTGRLRQSVAAVITRIGGRLQMRVGSDVSYAEVVHNGHGEIVPKTAKVLSFVPRGGVRVFTMRVRPVAGVPFLSRAIRIVLPGANVPDKLP